MKHVKANVLTYDAAVGRVEPGQDYLIEDDKAERWIFSGVATLVETPPPSPPVPDPVPEPIPAPEPAPAPTAEDDDEEGAEEDSGEHDSLLAGQVQNLHKAGDSQRVIADKLNISRATVRRYLAA